MNTALAALFSQQVTLEFAASRVYLHASVWFAQHHLSGFARWSRAQSTDERAHGLRVIDFLVMRCVSPIALDAPLPANVALPDAAAWESAQHVGDALLLLERAMTANMQQLVVAAREVGDLVADAFLMPIVLEQAQETANMDELKAKIDVYSVMESLIFHLDAQM